MAPCVPKPVRETFYFSAYFFFFSFCFLLLSSILVFSPFAGQNRRKQNEK